MSGVTSGITSEAAVHVEERGRESQPPHQGGKKARSTSKVRSDDFTILSIKVDALEKAMEEMVGKVEKIEGDMGTLESHTLSELGDLKTNVETLQNSEDRREEGMRSLETKVMDAITAMQNQLNSLRTSLEGQGRGSLVVGTSGPREVRVDLPKPKEFKGIRDAKEVENFLWQMERYTETLGLSDDETKVRTAAYFLTDNAMLWWRRKHADMERGLCTINTWEEFKKELKRQFYPENVVYEARKKLRELKHKTTISDYVRDFTSLTLQIPSLSGEELLFNFIDGLQNWAKHELQRRGVKDVDEAIAVAESLTEYQKEKGETSKPKSSKPSYGKGGGDKGKVGREQRR